MSTRMKYGGNAIPTGSTKIFGWLPYPVFGIGLGTVMASLLIIMFISPVVGLLVLALTFFVLLVGFVPIGNGDKTVIQLMAKSARHTMRKADGSATFVNSHLSNRQNKLGLPGFLNQIRTVDDVDGAGNPVQLLHHKSVDMATVSLLCSPTGASTLPQDQVNHQVSSYAGWLHSLSRDNGLLGAMIVVDSMKSSAVPMAESIMEKMDPNAPEVSRKVLLEATQALPSKISQVQTYATLGWKLSNLDEDLEGAFAEVTQKVPKHASMLAAAGSGQSHTMSGPEYGDLMYTAYNPHRSTEVEKEIHDGVRTVRPFAGSGPEYLNGTNKRVLLHDGVASMTVMMDVPDPSEITERTYEKLFSASDHVLRKRVAMYYRPIPASRQRSRIDSSSKGASTEAGSKRRFDAFGAKKSAAPKLAANQMTSGATLVEWSLMVTVTFEPTRKAQSAAENELKNIMAGLTWRFADHVPEAAFHQTLPLGIFPWVYAGVPELWHAAGAQKQDQKAGA
ncbi:hypothetical protein NBM05_03820 [Rothia sp. AR01]|uniref:Uncharacterized protein n=1 Tax=Rothia santali TaxID=2949643 RepID=A0A9X2HGA3_9MICC|nr:SCO6880 family protein [Rothia santali]MCP3425176.1 hypothetical protein [Rothia santali]